MKVTVVYSNARKESTYHCVQYFKEALQKEEPVEFTEFVLPRDMPHLCLGCFTCFAKGEDKCPHAASVMPIVDSLLAADGIVLVSPVYAMDISSPMKALFDHMCYLWLPHRPKAQMFSKIVMAISTTAGAGARSCVKSLKKSPRYWGVKHTMGYGIAIQAASWDHVTQAKKKKIEKAMVIKARRFTKAVHNSSKRGSPLFVRMMFSAMRKLLSGYKEDSMGYRDKLYWQEQGWLQGKSPF